MKAESITDDKVIRAMFAFALGVAFTVFAVADECNLFTTALGIIWCLISLFWVVKNVKEDWKS